jgi:hypothetical protein
MCAFLRELCHILLRLVASEESVAGNADSTIEQIEISGGINLGILIISDVDRLR